MRRALLVSLSCLGLLAAVWLLLSRSDDAALPPTAAVAAGARPAAPRPADSK